MKLSLEEKADLLEGHDSWKTLEIPEKGLRPLYMTDGPLGVRKKDMDSGSMLGLNKTLPSTAFPASAALANSWDEALTEQIACAIGEECRAYQVDVLLAPAMNIKRDPRCGRNFEYFSEDPLLSGKLAAAYCRGLEKTGTGACLKHFAMNNRENFRYMSNSLADERAIREIYLKNFEIAVREGHPSAVMCSYNSINGRRCSENPELMQHILREEWGFDGMVMTDWGATCDRVKGVMAGVDLDMPGGIRENREKILRAAEDGSLPMEVLNQSVQRILCLTKREKKGADPVESLFREHHALASEAAARCAVLLENDGTLPLKKTAKLLVMGELFENMRYQGAGSSDLIPSALITPREAFDRAGISYDYGMQHANASCDAVLFFGGLTETAESEGYDRENLRLPQKQIDQLKALSEKGIRPVLVLFGGSPMELPEMEYAAVLFMNLPGQGGGEAVYRLLFGLQNPAGKLAESWVRQTEDIAFGTAYGLKKNEYYRENIFVGYRFYEEVPQRLRYPFGHGLSYTHFDYEDMQVCSDRDKITVSFTLHNCGSCDGTEVVQLYAGRNEESSVFKAAKHLCTWQCVALRAGESQSVTLQFSKNELKYYHNALNQWILEAGDYPLYLGASVRDIRLNVSVHVDGQTCTSPYDRQVLEAYRRVGEEKITDGIFARTLPYALPEEPVSPPYTLETPLNEFRRSGWGRFVFHMLMLGMSTQYIPIVFIRNKASRDSELRHLRFVLSLIPHNSARSMIQSSGGIAQMNMAKGLVALANGHPVQALREFFVCPSGSR